MAKAVSMEPVPTTTWWIYLLEGIGAILIGLLLLMAPAATVVAITLFLGFYWLFVGVLELVRMFVDRSVPWYWSLLIGLLGIAAGLLVLNHPLFAAVILPATLVIYLGVLGIVIGPVLMLCSLEFVGRHEPAGWKLAGRLTPIAYIAWSLWLIAIGVALLV